MTTISLNLSRSGHRVLRLENSPAPLQNYGKLSKRKGVIRRQFSYSLCVTDCIFRLSKLLQMDAECQVGLDVIRCHIENLLKCSDRGWQVSGLLELVGRIVKSVSIWRGHGRTVSMDTVIGWQHPSCTNHQSGRICRDRTGFARPVYRRPGCPGLNPDGRRFPMKFTFHVEQQATMAQNSAAERSAQSAATEAVPRGTSVTSPA